MREQSWDEVAHGSAACGETTVSPTATAKSNLPYASVRAMNSIMSTQRAA